MALLFLIPGVIWFIFGICAFAGIGGDCNLKAVQGIFQIVQSKYHLTTRHFLLTQRWVYDLLNGPDRGSLQQS